MLKKASMLALMFIIPFSCAAQNPRVSEWARSFYIDAKLDQNYLDGIASFIYYMMEKKPSEKCFNKEVKRVRKNFANAPNYFQQSLVRLCSNCFAQTYKMSKQSTAPDQTLWRTALMEYYQVIYPLLDESHKTINYGPKKGYSLPELD